MPLAPAESQPSPLWMMTRDPQLTALVDELDAMRRAIVAAPSDRHHLRFSRTRLERVRERFAETIRQGEQKLHRLGELLCDTVLRCSYELQSILIGEIPRTRERFTLLQPLSARELYALTDIDLGNRQLRRLRLDDGVAWTPPTLVANYVEYQPLATNRYGIHKIISRIKAEEEIWNKVVDEIFELDALVRRDKQLCHLSRYVKDIFGIKLVVGTGARVRQMQRVLRALAFPDEALRLRGVPAGPQTRTFDWLEVKDYTGEHGRKESGWQAIKSVVDWWGGTFELQVQSLRSYHAERERLTQASHDSFRIRREELRNRVAEQHPLFGFYRDLLRWLFLSPEAPPPAFRSVEITVEP